MRFHAAHKWPSGQCQKGGSNSPHVQLYFMSKLSSLSVLYLWEKLTKSQLQYTAWLSFLTVATTV